MLELVIKMIVMHSKVVVEDIGVITAQDSILMWCEHGRIVMAIARTMPTRHITVQVVAVVSPRYELKSIEVNKRACNCRTTLLVRRQVTHTCESQWSDPKLASFIQGQEESGHTVHKGRKAKRTSWILRATTLGFIYTLDVLLSKLSLSVSVSSNDKVLTRRGLLIAYLIVLTDALS